MNNRPIEIHEFSTGIKPDVDANGNWLSTGFTGRYMNCTLPEIPYNVERAIANKLFAVVEGYTTKQPVIIGRVIQGSTNSRNELGRFDWSVVAIVSLGRDEKGRPLTVYRYFLCQEDFGLLKIVTWIQNHDNKLPIFNPFDEKQEGIPNILQNYETPKNQINLEKDKDEIKRIIEKNTIPRIKLLQSIQEVNLSDIYFLTFEIIKRHTANYVNGKNIWKYISWAYNVEALEEPFEFIYINPANLKAFKRINKIVSDRHQKTLAPAPLASLDRAIDKQKLKTAIKSLMSGSVIPDAVEIVFEALQNDKVTEDIWQDIFNSEGATRAIQQGIRSPQMLHLLTLRAVVIPETFLDFLKWFEDKNTSIDKQAFLDFQYNVRSYLVRSQIIEDNLFAGIIKAFESLKVSTRRGESYKNTVDLKILVWFLKQNKSLWNMYSNRVIESVEIDLIKICNLETNFKYSQNLWQGIIYLYSSNYKHNAKKIPFRKEYKQFAILFEYLGKYNSYNIEAFKVSAYFYQISQGIVPDNVFHKAFSDKKSEEEFLGIIVQKKLTLEETLVKKSTQFVKTTGEFIFDFVEQLENLQYFLILISILLLSVGCVYWYVREMNTNSQNLIQKPDRKENFNSSMVNLQNYLEIFPHKSLSKNEQFLFLIDEISLTSNKECLKEKNQPFSFSKKYKDINDDCREILENSFLDYEKEIVYKTEQENIEPDGIIDQVTINYIKSRLSGIFNHNNKRYKQLTVKIFKNLEDQINKKINEINKENGINKEINIDYWFKIALKNTITTESENLTIPNEYLDEIKKTNKDVKNNPRKYTKMLVDRLQYSSLENVSKPNNNNRQKSQEWMEKVWIERIFASCLKSQECTISSTITEDETIQSFGNFVESELLPEIEEITNKYVEVIRIKNNLENRFNDKKLLAVAIAEFKTSLNSIQDIENDIYLKLLSKLGKNIELSSEQEKKIRNEIQQKIKRTLSIYDELDYISQKEIDQAKNIKLDKLESTLNIDNLDYFKSQLRWIEGIYGYQNYSEQDGIISGSKAGTGATLKDFINKHEFESLLAKAKEIINQ